MLRNVFDGFDRVVQALDALGNYVDTGAGYSAGHPFLDPDGRVIRSDSYGNAGRALSPIVRLASSLARFDEGGRQYEAQQQVFVAAGTVLPSSLTASPLRGHAHRRRPGGQPRRQRPPGPR